MTYRRTKVYFSSLLADRFPVFTENLKMILQVEDVLVEFLYGTKDIWCRDYMPVRMSKDEYVQFVYKPDYLVGFEDRRTNPDFVTPKIDAHIFHSKLVIDGGNVVKNDRTAILTDRIFKDNPAFRRRKPELLKHLALVLAVEKVVIIPSDPSDISGHADGMVRFVAENTVIINEYHESDGYARSFITNSAESLKAQGIHIAGTLPYRAFDRKNADDDYTAIGCYLNYLDLGNMIIFPTFGISEDNEAINKIHQYFSSKRIFRLDCREIAEEGGVLNCISWNL